MKDKSSVQKGVTPDMTVLYQNKSHYNLIISKDSELAKHGNVTSTQNVANNKASGPKDAQTATNLKCFPVKFVTLCVIQVAP